MKARRECTIRMKYHGTLTSSLRVQKLTPQELSDDQCVTPVGARTVKCEHDRADFTCGCSDSHVICRNVGVRDMLAPVGGARKDYSRLE